MSTFTHWWNSSFLFSFLSSSFLLFSFFLSFIQPYMHTCLLSTYYVPNLIVVLYSHHSSLEPVRIDHRSPRHSHPWRQLCFTWAWMVLHQVPPHIMSFVVCVAIFIFWVLLLIFKYFTIFHEPPLLEILLCSAKPTRYSWRWNSFYSLGDPKFYVLSISWIIFFFFYLSQDNIRSFYESGLGKPSFPVLESRGLYNLFPPNQGIQNSGSVDTSISFCPLPPLIRNYFKFRFHCFLWRLIGKDISEKWHVVKFRFPLFILLHTCNIKNGWPPIPILVLKDVKSGI